MSDSHQLKIRTILAHTLYSNNSSIGNFGFVKPIAEIVDDKLVEITEENFCPSMKVFITSHYDELETRFQSNEIFKLDVHVSERLSENVDPTYACKYVSGPKRAEPLKPKEFFEIIRALLPDPSDRVVEIDRALPGTRYVFIDDGSTVYGPLKWSVIPESINTIKLEFIDGPLPGVKLESYQIYKIERSIAFKSFVIASDGSSPRCLIQGLSILSGSDYHDYASDDEIVRFCAKIASENNVKILDKSKIDALVTYLLKLPKSSFPFVKNRVSRLPGIATSTIDLQGDLIENFSNYLNSENGKIVVSEYVEKNKSHFLDTLKKEREAELNELLEFKKEEIRNADARLKELNENKVALSVQVEEIRKATKQEAVLDSARAEADSKLRQRKHELADMERAILEKQGILDGLLTLENIQRKIETAEQNQKYAWKRETDLNSAINDLKSQLGTTEDALRKKLTELKPFVEAINGSFSTGEIVQSEIAVKTYDFKSDESLLVKQRAIIGKIKSTLLENGRSLSDWQIANILISTQQSFIVFLAGLPGVGKTSLARLLAHSQDIKPRIKEVSVARGWTSQKDLIGFYNPLTSRFQPSNTGAYNFLLPLSKEKKDHSQAMAYILLDEANLSPIEHYWSSFMGMTDGEGDQVLMLGQDQLKIPDCLRFIATINYDSTTEPLSPRIVDRAPIIVIDPTELGSLHREIIGEIQENSLPISAIQMQELFGNELLSPELESAEKLTFDTIKRTLLDNDPTMGRPISISPRKELAIRQYCNKARGVMNAENDLLALDIAILQHILPLVRGHGVRFAKRLETLRRDLETSSLPQSSKFVSKMISFGETDLHTYDFFCW